MAAEILVISDTHGNPNKILKALSCQVKKPNYLLFLGDGIRDLAYCDFHGDISVYSVLGNCDFCTSIGTLEAETEHIIDINGIRIMMTHGHKYHVKYGDTDIIYAAQEKGVDILLFGHTHIPIDRSIEYNISNDRDGKKLLHILNPGSLGYGDTWGNITIDRHNRILLSHGRL